MGRTPDRAVVPVDWVDFEEGQQRAKAEGKLRVVGFYVAEGCHWCAMMDERVYGNPTVAQKLNREFVPVRVHLDRGLSPGAKALGKRYDFNFDCLLMVCDADGNAVPEACTGRMCFADAVDAGWCAAYLDQANGKAPDEDFFADM